MSQVRVAVHAALDPEASGGVQTNLVSLAHGLREHSRYSRATFLSPPPLMGRWERLVSPNHSVVGWRHVFPWYRGGADDLEAARALVGNLASKPEEIKKRDSEIRAGGTDVLHFPYQVAFDSEIPTIYEPWDLQHIKLPDLFSPGERAWRDALYQRACERAAIVVTATEATKQDVCEAYGIAPDKVVVVYRDTRLLPEPVALHLTHSIEPKIGKSADYVFYPAATFAHKNHSNLIEAAVVLRDKFGMNIKFICSGKQLDANKSSLNAQIERHRLSEMFMFAGVVSEDHLARLFRGARVVAFPSLFEGLGLPLLEAMQCDVPIAASRASCIPEVVNDAALLFDPDDPSDIAEKIAAIWEDSSLQANLVEAGRRRRQDFAWPKAIAAFEEVYLRANQKR